MSSILLLSLPFAHQAFRDKAQPRARIPEAIIKPVQGTEFPAFFWVEDDGSHNPTYLDQSNGEG